jgi:hypothetical protein
VLNRTTGVFEDILEEANGLPELADVLSHADDVTPDFKPDWRHAVHSRVIARRDPSANRVMGVIVEPTFAARSWFAIQNDRIFTVLVILPGSCSRM